MTDETNDLRHGESRSESRSVSRRDLLSGAAAALAAAAVTGAPARLLASTDDWRVDLTPPRLAGNGSMMGVPFEKHATVRIAIVGTGLRGSSVLSELLAIEGVEITALADIVPEKAQRAADRVVKAGRKAPALYTNGERDFERLVQRDDIDFVYTATPWPWHTPVVLAAMLLARGGGGLGCRSVRLEQQRWSASSLAPSSRADTRTRATFFGCSSGYSYWPASIHYSGPSAVVFWWDGRAWLRFSHSLQLRGLASTSRGVLSYFS